MGRQYTFADLNTDEKPKITACARTFGDVTYPYECKGRTATGYGFTPLHAYRQWEKNWSRRFRYYEAREKHAAQTIALHQRVEAQAPRSKGKNYRCQRCGLSGFIWKQTDRGWRLFTPDPFEMHTCQGDNHG